jgi:hypothetical protein
MGELKDRSRRVFGRLTTFENAFPTVEEAIVEFTESDFGLSKRTGTFYLHEEGGMMACGNPYCRRGGYEFDRELSVMVRHQDTEKRIRVACPGDEGSPKGRKIGRRCSLSVDGVLRVKYKSPSVSPGWVPTPGDRVGAIGHNGVFKIIAVNTDTRRADLRLASGIGPTVRGVPWSTLVVANAEEL